MSIDKPKDLLEIHDKDSWLKCYLNIEEKMLLHIEEYDDNSDLDFFGEEVAGEWSIAGIALNKEQAILLRDKLTKFIET
jgi:hypothetical protein